MSESGQYSDEYSDTSDVADNDYNDDYDYTLGEYYDDEEVYNHYDDDSYDEHEDEESYNYSDEDDYNEHPEIVYGSHQPTFKTKSRRTIVNDTYSRYYNRVWDLIVIFLILGVALFVGFKSI